MINFKKVIAEEIAKNLSMQLDDVINFIEVPINEEMGDYSFPCFKLAKELKKSPIEIANNLKENLDFDKNKISNIEVVNGYLNFFINKTELTKTVLETIDIKKEMYGSSEIGNGKTVLIEFSSPNIAKEFHIGHLKNTIIGHCLYNLYKFSGYNTISLNHLGDYGTQFAKLIEGYKRWGTEYDFSKEPIAKMADMYVRINQLCSEDEEVLEECRRTFKKLEDGDEYCVKLWKEFKDLSLVEFNEIYNLLGVKFDSMNGEAFYSDKMQEVIDILEEKGVVEESQGAKIIDLSDKGINTPCIIQKTDGSSIYATRDLAAVMYRARTYDFDKCLYVVGIEQSLHFKQIFEVSKLLVDSKYTDGLEHISYGMIRLPEGKMSSRKGNFVTAKSLIKETVSAVEKIMEDREIENKKEIAEKIGIGAIVFNNLSESRVKDSVFDLNQALNFNGETGPYLQYIYVRTNSILQKLGYIPKIEEIDFEVLKEESAIKIIKRLYNFGDVIEQAVYKNESYMLTKLLIEIAQEFSSFYNDNKIIVEDKKLQDARLYLTYAVNIVLKTGANLLGMQMPEKM